MPERQDFVAHCRLQKIYAAANDASFGNVGGRREGKNTLISNRLNSCEISHIAVIIAKLKQYKHLLHGYT